MAAYLLAFAKVKNAPRVAEYSSAAGPTLAAVGATVITRGRTTTIAGSFSADSCLIVKFNDVASLHAWYKSPEYQALIPLRDEVLDPNFLVLEEPA